MSNALETLLRRSYARRLPSQQWAHFTAEYLQSSSITDQASDLCDLLLKHTFSSTAIETSLIHNYLQYAVLGDKLDTQVKPSKEINSGSLIAIGTFLKQISKLPQNTIAHQPHQWAVLLRVTHAALEEVKITTQFPSSSDDEWKSVADDLLSLLADIVGNGLYQNTNSSDGNELELQELGWQSDVNLRREQSSLLLPNNNMPSASQFSFDPEATLDLDMLEDTAALDEDEIKPVLDVEASQTSEQYDENNVKTRVGVRNAITAAEIFMKCLEDEDVLNMLKADGAEGRKARLLAILLPENQTPTSSAVANNATVQKLLIAIKQLSESVSEKHKIVHMKYHELEDEGTARAMPSAGLMGLIYHIAQIRPSLPDKDIVERMMKLQRIKGAFDESFYLELWLAGLTGLAEATQACSSAQLQKDNGKEDADLSKNKHNCTLKTVTDQLLWKTLVLVKIPSLIQQFQEMKSSTMEDITLNSENIADKQQEAEGDGEDAQIKHNALESSLFELQAFSGLLNACNSSSCCSLLFTPASWAESGGNNKNADEDELMMMLNDMSDVDDGLNIPAVIKAVNSVSSRDIFQLIVQVCLEDKFLRLEVAKELLTTVSTSSDKAGVQKAEPADDINALLDTSMLDFGGDLAFDTSPSNENENEHVLIKQNLEQRIKVIEENPTTLGTSDLINIAMLSLNNLKTVTDFILTFIRQKADSLDLRSMAPICESVSQNPCFLDLIFQLYQPSDLLVPLEFLCNDWNRSNYTMDMDDNNEYGSQGQDVDDLQSSFEDFGKVWYLINLIISKFDLSGDLSTAFVNPTGYCYTFFLQYPAVYDSGMADDHIEQFISMWMTALFGNDGISDALLRSSTPQLLIKVSPTLFERSMYAYEAGEMGLQNLLGGIAYFKEKFLSYVLAPSAMSWLCTELLYNKSVAAITIMRELLQSEDIPDIFVLLSATQILGTFDALDIHYRTEAESTEDDTQAADVSAITPYAQEIYSRISATCQRQHVQERGSETGIIGPDNLFSRARDMLRYMVKSGRSMYMRDVEADTFASSHPQDNVPDEQAHYLDMSIFKAALEIGGNRWFLLSIVEEVLEAGQAGGAVRAAEIGSCLVATPLSVSVNAFTSTLDMLRCLLVDIIPSVLACSSPIQDSFFQGQTLGVFISDCLVLTKGFSIDDATSNQAQAVEAIGKQFLRQLATAANFRQKKRDSEDEQPSPKALGPFASCSDEVIKSPLFRGVIKGLKSNTILYEKWPNISV
ncbi:mediator complex subunit Med5-domain-containing protein [Umbelopsis sp. AD052]|nr:mediator complex subunit Med5-domain-containing protein [Umbelopsis sp. AD052]